MKNRYLYLIVIMVMLFLVFSFFSSFKTSASTLIDEEASPIREEDKIVGINYVITIGEGVKKDNVYVSTSILPSINHYKDINSIDDFNIDLKLVNNSNYKYSIKKILMINKGDVREIKFNKNKKNTYIYFKLKRDDIVLYEEDSYIQIKLEK